MYLNSPSSIFYFILVQQCTVSFIVSRFFLAYLVTQTLALRGVKQLRCKLVSLHRICNSLLLGHNRNQRRHFLYLVSNLLQTALGPKSFFLSFFYTTVLLFLVFFSSSFLQSSFLSWDIKQSSEILFYGFQYMPVFWEVTASKF